MDKVNFEQVEIIEDYGVQNYYASKIFGRPDFHCLGTGSCNCGSNFALRDI